MTEISAKQLVGAALASADRLLRAFFSAHPGPQGSARIVLHARDLQHPAVVTLTPAHRPGDMTPRYAVHWEPDGGGPYPVFDGQLSVGGSEDYDEFWLVLDGGYQPPLGIPGKVFDAVLGHRIADETARALLVDVAREIEAHVAQEEAAKRR